MEIDTKYIDTLIECEYETSAPLYNKVYLTELIVKILEHHQVVNTKIPDIALYGNICSVDTFYDSTNNLWRILQSQNHFDENYYSIINIVTMDKCEKIHESTLTPLINEEYFDLHSLKVGTKVKAIYDIEECEGNQLPILIANKNNIGEIKAIDIKMDKGDHYIIYQVEWENDLDTSYKYVCQNDIEVIGE